jgi:hypothetical protein
MSQRRPAAATSTLSVAPATALRIKNALPPDGGGIDCRTSSRCFRRSGWRSRFRCGWRGYSKDRNWRIAVNPHFQVSYFGCVVNRIVAGNARYPIRFERTHNRGMSRILVKAAHARMAVQALRVAVRAN